MILKSPGINTFHDWFIEFGLRWKFRLSTLLYQEGVIFTAPYYLSCEKQTRKKTQYVTLLLPEQFLLLRVYNWKNIYFLGLSASLFDLHWLETLELMLRSWILEKKLWFYKNGKFILLIR